LKRGKERGKGGKGGEKERREEIRAGLTIPGAHTNVRRGLFSHMRSQDFI